MNRVNSASAPVKLYYRIGEVANIVGVETHVLRYWETEFRTIRPEKSRRGQRVYSRKDVERLLKVKELLAQDTLERKRRGKTYDLRPLLDSLEVIEMEGRATLRMTLSSSQQGTGRPDEVLDALGIDASLARIQRKRLILSEEG